MFPGHRVTKTRPFRNIDQLVPGDQVIFTVNGVRSVYVMTANQIVKPTQMEIVDPTPTPTVTLVRLPPARVGQVPLRREAGPRPGVGATLKVGPGPSDRYGRRGVPMPHMVVFRSNEGKPGYHQAEALDDAVKFVERLRNQENVTEARIFRMQEVPIEFKTYYRVEVGTGSAEPTAEARPPRSPSPTAKVEPAAAGSGRFGRFGK